MAPLILCSIVALAIVCERLWSLQGKKIIPKHLVAQVWYKIKNNQMNASDLKTIKETSSLGRILAAGLANMHNGRDQMKEAIEDVGRHEAHKMERYLTTLGTIAAISPLLGLLGTVVGMIKVFTTISAVGVGNAGSLSTGISEALLTTAAGLTVAIPSLIAFRYLRARVDGLIVYMEQEALKLIEVVHGQRSKEGSSDGEPEQ